MNVNDYGAITLGQLIDTLEAADQTLVVRDGFGHPDSWRGVYAFLRFSPERDTTVADMLTHARSAVGTTYTGYKGGDFTMTRESPCFIDGYGDSSDDAAITPERLKAMLGVDVAEVRESNMPVRPKIIDSSSFRESKDEWCVDIPLKRWNEFQAYVEQLRVMTKYPLKVEIEVDRDWEGVHILHDAWDAYKEHVCKLEGIAARLDS
jgi:hypothetical protein